MPTASKGAAASGMGFRTRAAVRHCKKGRLARPCQVLIPRDLEQKAVWIRFIGKAATPARVVGMVWVRRGILCSSKKLGARKHDPASIMSTGKGQTRVEMIGIL